MAGSQATLDYRNPLVNSFTLLWSHAVLTCLMKVMNKVDGRHGSTFSLIRNKTRVEMQ